MALAALDLVEHPNYTLTTNIAKGLAATVEKCQEEYQLEEDWLNSSVMIHPIFRLHPTPPHPHQHLYPLT